VFLKNMSINKNFIECALIYVHSSCNVSAAIRLLKVQKYKKVYIVAHRGISWPLNTDCTIIESSDNYLMEDYDHLVRITRFIDEKGPLEVFLPHSFSLLSYALHLHEKVVQISYLEEGEGTFTAAYDFTHEVTLSTACNEYTFHVLPQKLQRIKWIIHLLSIILPVKKATNKFTALMLYTYWVMNRRGFIDFTNEKFGAVWITEEYCPCNTEFRQLESVKITKVEQQSKALVLLPPSELIANKDEQLLKILDKIRKSLFIKLIDVKKHPGDYKKNNPLYIAYFDKEIQQITTNNDIIYWAYENGYKAVILFGSSSLFYGALISRDDPCFITMDLYNYLFGEDSSGFRFLKQTNKSLSKYVQTELID